MRLKKEQRVTDEAKDREALRAFHVHPYASVIVVLRNGVALDPMRSVGDITRAVPEYWQPGLKFFTPSYVLGEGTWWKWIKSLYGGRVPRT